MMQITFFIYSLGKSLGRRRLPRLPGHYADLRFHASVLHFSGAGRRRIAWRGQRFSTNPVLKNPGGGWWLRQGFASGRGAITGRPSGVHRPLRAQPASLPIALRRWRTQPSTWGTIGGRWGDDGFIRLRPPEKAYNSGLFCVFSTQGDAGDDENATLPHHTSPFFSLSCGKREKSSSPASPRPEKPTKIGV
jgi:hypothetical protein